MTTEEKVLAISNDISEDCLSPKVTKKDLVESILYWRNLFDVEVIAHRETRDRVLGLATKAIEIGCVRRKD